MTEPSPAPASIEHGGHVWYTASEAARRLGVTTGRIYHLTSAGRVTTRAQHGLTYIRADSVEAYRRYQTQLLELRATGRALAAGR